MSHYMQQEAVQLAYQKITAKNPLENAVNNFWLTVLKNYFPSAQKYLIEFEAHPLSDTSNRFKQRADITITHIKNEGPKKLILMEDKRKGLETSTKVWQSALAQVLHYCQLARTDNGEGKEVLYVAVNIGTYTRFYQLEPKVQNFVDYPGTEGKVFEVKNDEEEIHRILQELVAKTSY